MRGCGSAVWDGGDKGLERESFIIPNLLQKFYVFDTTHLTIKLLILDHGLTCDECMRVCL